MKTKVFLITLLLGLFCINSSYAQLGNVLKKAKDKAKEVVQETTKETTKETVIQESVTETVKTVAAPPDIRAAIDKLTDESKRETPNVWALEYGAERGGGATGGETKNHATYIINIPSKTREEVLAFKKELEARHAENMAIYAALFDTAGIANSQDIERDLKDFKYKPGAKEALSNTTKHHALLEDILRYHSLMDRARGSVTEWARIEIKNGRAEVDLLQVGTRFVTQRNGEFYFIYNDGGENVVGPADEEMFQLSRNKYSNLALLLRQEPPTAQYPELGVAQVANQFIFMAQKNSIAKEDKKPIPASQMNNPTLTDKMLKLAQKQYPDWGIVKLIIAESAWRPETNALGQIIHRRINTKIILPRSSGGHVMRTLSFIEPYAGGGNYGEAKPYGIGTDEVAVDYK